MSSQITASDGAPRGRPVSPFAAPSSRRRRALRTNAVASRVVVGAAALSIVLIVLVVAFLLVRALPVFSAPAIGAGGFFLSTAWQPDLGGGGFGDVVSTFGALAPIFGSLLAVALALVIATPLSLALALVMEETNPVLGNQVLRPAIEVFVGIPSVVYGYLGLTILVPIVRHFGTGGDTGQGLLAAGIVLALMIVPTITALTADGLRAVPRSLKEASHALGATEWQTMARVLLPSARANIVSGVVLGLARAMGEALAVALVIGDVNAIPNFRESGLAAFVKPFTTMTVAITDGIQNLAINPDGTAARYMLALVLLVITFLCIVVVRFVNRHAPEVVS